MHNEKTHNSQGDCPFCSAHKKMQIEAAYKTAIAVRDRYPVTRDHLLIVPVRHVADYFSLTSREKSHVHRLLTICKEAIAEKDLSVSGFNIGINCGESAGQTIFHCHIHLIPRRNGDNPAPRGGVRGVIPEKMNYPLSQ